MRPARTRPCCAALLLAGAWLAGCARAPLVIAFESVPRTMDPHHHNEVVAWSLLANFYDGLVRFSPDMRLEPALAERWERMDATQVRFQLRPGLRDHRGRPIGAADVVASLLRAQNDPRSRVRHHTVGIVDVRVEGEHAVVIRTAEPSPTLLNRLPFLLVLPADEAARAEIDSPIGTGPYRFIERRADGAVVGRAFAGWAARPAVTDVVFTFVEADDARTAQLLAGETDIAVRLPFDDVDAVARHPGRRVETQPKLSVQLLEVDPSRATGAARQALLDPRVRRALLLGIDRARLAASVLRGNAAAASQYVHPVVFGFDPGIEPAPYAPEEARRLLAEAGFPDGFEVTLGHGSTYPGVPRQISEDLAAIGVRVALQPLSFGELVRRSAARPVALRYFGRLCTTGDASELLDSTFHTPDPAGGLGAENYNGYSDLATDILLDQANREMDPPRRLELLQQAQRRVLADLPTLPLVVIWEYVGATDRVELVLRHDAWMWVAGFTWRS